MKPQKNFVLMTSDDAAIAAAVSRIREELGPEIDSKLRQSGTQGLTDMVGISYRKICTLDVQPPLDDQEVPDRTQDERGNGHGIAEGARRVERKEHTRRPHERGGRELFRAFLRGIRQRL